MPFGDVHRASRRDRIAIAVAVAASLVAHVVLLLVVARGGASAPAPRPERIAVQLVPLPPPEPSAPVAPPAVAAPRHPASGVEQPGPGRTPARADRARPPPALSEEGLAPEPAGPRAAGVPDLRPRLSLVAPPPRSAADPAAPARGGEVDGLRSWAAELAGRARVESGLAHPYHGDLAKALARSWDAERAVKARGLSGYLANAGDSLRTFARTWARMADGYGRTGQPSLLDGGSERFRELSGLPEGPARDALVNAEAVRQLRKAWSEGHVASVRVVQGRDGRLESVKLVAPSSDDALDREALEAVPRAVAAMPAPSDVLAGRERLATVWEFEIEVSISPPLPVVGVEFDEVLGGLDLRVPLDRRIWKRVRLVAIE